MQSCDPSMLADFRTLLIFGLGLTGALLILLNLPLRKPAGPAKGAKAFCKLHQRAEGTCPPGSHEE